MLANAGVFLSAEVFDTPGLPGYQTYELTATTADGYLNGFDFVGGGIGGPLYQSDADDRLFGGSSAGSADSHWLVDSSDGFTVQAAQSPSELSGAIAFSQSSGLRDSYRSLPFARLVTNDPSAVRIQGEFLLARRYNDTVQGFGSSVLSPVDSWLSEISTDGVPTLGSFAEPPGPTAAEIAIDPVAAHEADWAKGRAVAAETSDWTLYNNITHWGVAAAERGDSFDEWYANRAADTDWRVGEVVAEPIVQPMPIDRLTLLSTVSGLHNVLHDVSMHDLLLAVNRYASARSYLTLVTGTSAQLEIANDPGIEIRDLADLSRPTVPSTGLARAMARTLAGLGAAETTGLEIGRRIPRATPLQIDFFDVSSRGLSSVTLQPLVTPRVLFDLDLACRLSKCLPGNGGLTPTR